MWTTIKLDCISSFHSYSFPLRQVSSFFRCQVHLILHKSLLLQFSHLLLLDFQFPQGSPKDLCLQIESFCFHVWFVKWEGSTAFSIVFLVAVEEFESLLCNALLVLLEPHSSQSIHPAGLVFWNGSNSICIDCQEFMINSALCISNIRVCVAFCISWLLNQKGVLAPAR